MNNEAVLEVRHLKKYFVKSAGILSTLLREQRKYVAAVEDVSFSINKGEIFCVAGESGCGKTTLGKTILKLLQPDDGQIIFQGQDITRLERDNMRMLRPKVQMIFQDPYESLDPRARIYDSIAEPLMVNHLVKDENEKHNKVIQTLQLAGLTPVENYLYKYPHNLSGGERQRVGIATALVLDPEFIVADEPTSMLDVSVQANLLNLLRKLRREKNLTYLFITHDLSVAYAFSDWLAIMYLGKFVEVGPTAEVIMSPIHPYTKALISVVPGINLSKNIKPIVLPGETPNPENVPAGCRFHPRCYCKEERCTKEEPIMTEFTPHHYAACFVLEKMKLKENGK
ncbi:MAG: ABC transporter ATP-binding protein [Dehalococcoidia bacterium]|nr:ABC transporter ATP-binding protein [Dehalococcoidia bacterium]